MAGTLDSGVEEHVIQIDDLPFKYYKVGTGNHVVLCLCGAMGTPLTDFELQLRHMNRDRFTLLAWEPLGRGTNDFLKSMDNHFRELEADYAGKFMDKLGVQEYSILGFCHGGNVGIILASKHKRRVRKLVVVAAVAFVGPAEYDHAIHFLCRTDVWNQSLRQAFIDAYGHDRLIKLSNAMAQGIKDDYSKRGGKTSVEFLGKVVSDTMVLQGDRDAMISLDHSSFFLDNLKTLKKSVIIQGGKHYVQRRNYVEFNAAVENFLLSG